MDSKERFINLAGQTIGKITQEQTMTTRKHKQNHFFFPRLIPTTDLLLFSFPSTPPKLCGCSLCAVLQSGDCSSYCPELDIPPYVHLPCCPRFLCRPRWGWVLPESWAVLAGPRRKWWGLMQGSWQRRRQQPITAGVSKSLEEPRVTSLFMLFISPYSL